MGHLTHFYPMERCAIKFVHRSPLKQHFWNVSAFKTRSPCETEYSLLPEKWFFTPFPVRIMPISTRSEREMRTRSFSRFGRCAFFLFENWAETSKKFIFFFSGVLKSSSEVAWLYFTTFGLQRVPNCFPYLNIGSECLGHFFRWGRRDW